MASTERTSLAERARRAYERGRVLGALRRAPLPLLLACVAAAVCPYPALALGCGILLVVVFTVCLWRGEGAHEGAFAGLLAGSAVLLVPLLLTLAGHACFSGACWPVCRPGCIAAGLIAGLAVGAGATRRRHLVFARILAGAVVTLLVAVPACAFAGLFGILGMVAAFAATSVPAAALSVRAR